MATNKQAKQKIRKAINVLQDSLFTNSLSDSQRKRIKLSLSLLYDAYSELSGLAPDISYRDAAGYLNAASSRLIKIRDERLELANELASAGKILGAVTGVLALF
jgi:hypothetical protein